MVGRGAVGDHGRNLPDQGPARIRLAPSDDWRLLHARRRVENPWRKSSSRQSRPSPAMDNRAQPMAFQLAVDYRDRRWNCHLLRALHGLEPCRGLGEGAPDGVAGERRPLLPSFRPSRSNLSLHLRDLRAGGAVGRPASSGPDRDSWAPGDEPERSDRFTLVYFWATFVFFTLSGSRRSYYLLPILPAASMIIARLLMGGEVRSPWARRLLNFAYSAIAIAALLGIFALVPARWILPGRWATLPPLPDPAVFVIGWLLCVAGVIYAVRRYEPVRVAVSMGVIAYVAMAYIYIFAMP